MSPLFCLRYPLPKPLDKLRYRTMQPFATYSTFPHPNPALGEGLRGEGLAAEAALRACRPCRFAPKSA